MKLIRIYISALLGLFVFANSLAAQTQTQPEEPSPLAIAFERMQSGETALARGILEPLASEGNADAQHMLGYMEERGLGGAKNLKRALDLYSTAALAGSLDAQFALGELAFLGDGVKRDYKRAAGWFTLAADGGHVQAKMRLGVMYSEGLGFKIDRNQAVIYFREAAELGYSGAQYNMGVAHLVGQGAPQDYQQAAEWFKKSAAQGSPDAQYNLALLYDSSFLGDPQPEETVKWMAAAASGGLPAAFVAMGLMVHDGRAKADEGEETSVAAADWFEKAARAGEPQGQYLYAVSLAEGDGREADPAQAKIWLERSLAQDGALHPQTKAGAEELLASIEVSLQGQRILRD